MVLRNSVKIYKWFVLSLAMGAGILVGGATMIYLLTIPGVRDLALLQVSLVYTLTVFGIMFFSSIVGICVSMFARDIILKDMQKGVKP